MNVTEEKLILVSGTLVIVGIFALWYAITLLEENPITYEEFIAEKEVRVVLEGEVVGSRISGDMTFVDFRTNCTLPGIIFAQQEVREGTARITGTKQY